MVQPIPSVYVDPEHLAKLNHLLQLVADAIQLYDRALERVDDPVLRDDLSLFRNDHKRHAADLHELIVDLGGHAIVPSMKVKAPTADAMAQLRSAPRVKSVLAALRTCEQWIVEMHDGVASLPLPKLAW